MQGGLFEGSRALLFIRNTFGSLILILACPPLAFWLCDTIFYGGLLNFYNLYFSSNGLILWINHILNFLMGSQTSWIIVLIFCFIEMILMIILPGKIILGSPTTNGNIPKHKINGFKSFIVTIILFEIFNGTFPSVLNIQFKCFNGSILYKELLPLLGSFTIFSVLICIFLYIKGIFYPSSSDSGSSGNVIFDFYWGVELYPRVYSIDIKPLIHSRIGMTLWAMLNISYLHAQFEYYGTISNALWMNVIFQLIYIGKHHWWEEGYMKTTDIIHDYEGYYLVYGCIVFMPFTFTLSGISLVSRPLFNWNYIQCIIISIMCIYCIYLNYEADDQKQRVRAFKGNCKIWGKKPEIIRIKTDSVDSILLVDGWWRVSRHFHYLADIGGVFFWTLPGGYPWNNPIIYFYWLFLTILFIDRAKRDDIRCKRKYGKYWDQYTSKVPYKIFPYIY